MRYFLSLVLFALMISCDQNQQAETETTTDNGDPIRTSQTYKSYVIAHAEYNNCVDTRSELTQKLLDNKISREEFDKRIGTNTRVCQLKKQVVDLYWRVLESEFDNITSDYNLMPKKEGQ